MSGGGPRGGRRNAHAMRSLQMVAGDLVLGLALTTSGDAFEQLMEQQYALDTEVDQVFLDPLRKTIEGQLKEIAAEHKKLEGRRLDYNVQVKKLESAQKAQKPTGEYQDKVNVAWGKVKESRDERLGPKMQDLRNQEAEHVQQLSALLGAHITYFQNSLAVLTEAKARLDEMAGEADAAERVSYKPPAGQPGDTVHLAAAGGDSYAAAGAAASGGGGGGAADPIVDALYDFEAENPGELSFAAGAHVKLTARIDDNWLQGEVDGRSGIFPATYVSAPEGF